MTDQNEMNRINEAVEAAVEKAMEKAQEKDKTGGQAAEDLEKRISEAVNKALDGRLQSKGSQEGQHPPSVTVQSSPSHSSSSGSEGARQQQLDPSNLPLIKEKDQHQNNLQSLAATSLGNLLQQLGALDKGAMDEDRLAGAGCGILLGEALPPVPTKLANKIKKGDFVEMQEMLPDMWLVTDQSEPTARVGRLRAMDIKVWSQCFATYVRVIAEDEPERVPDLLDYMINIIRASQDFMGSAWLKYDNTFRRQVAVSGNKKWGTYNSSLYSMCFTGKAQTLGRCEHCLSKDHNLQPCPLRSDQPPAQLEINHSHPKEYSQASNESWPRCRRFNEGRCDHVDCSYRHVCIKCGERHPAIYCGQQGRGWRGRSRGRAPRRRPY